MKARTEFRSIADGMPGCSIAASRPPGGEKAAVFDMGAVQALRRSAQCPGTDAYRLTVRSGPGGSEAHANPLASAQHRHQQFQVGARCDRIALRLEANHDRRQLGVRVVGP